jgi:hypothetical protein
LAVPTVNNTPIAKQRIRRIRVLFNTAEDSFKKITDQDYVDYSQMSLAWFHERITAKFKGTKETLFQDQIGTKTTNILPGTLCFYGYDPKTKETLPYYDKFPLIIVIDAHKNGFSGLNVHYLPPAVRIKVFRELMRINGHREQVGNDVKKIKATYDFLKGISNGAVTKHAYKNYLFSHVRTKFIRVAWKDAHMAIFLPVESFSKKSKQHVWKQL